MKRAVFLLAALTSTLASTTNAGLISRLGGLAVYDTDLDITWLADANLAATETFGVDGINPDGTMSWNKAYYQWLPAMNAYDGTGYLGVGNWRLPITLQPDPTCSNPTHETLGSVGFNCTGSEMGHLYYVELSGGLDSGDPDVALFSNLDIAGFWSDTRVPEQILGCCDDNGEPELQDWVYYFNFVTSPARAGDQSAGDIDQDSVWVPWAVADGDPLAVSAPAPLGLLLAGLLGLAFTLRRPAGGPARRSS